MRTRRFCSILFLGISTSCCGGNRAAQAPRAQAQPLNSTEIESATGTASPYLHRGGAEDEEPAGIPLQPVRGEEEPAGISLQPAVGVEEPYAVIDAGVAAAPVVPDAPRPPGADTTGTSAGDARPADRLDAPAPGLRRLP